MWWLGKNQQRFRTHLDLQAGGLAIVCGCELGRSCLAPRTVAGAKLWVVTVLEPRIMEVDPEILLLFGCHAEAVPWTGVDRRGFGKDLDQVVVWCCARHGIQACSGHAIVESDAILWKYPLAPFLQSDAGLCTPGFRRQCRRNGGNSGCAARQQASHDNRNDPGQRQPGGKGRWNRGMTNANAHFLADLVLDLATGLPLAAFRDPRNSSMNASARWEGGRSSKYTHSIWKRMAGSSGRN